MACLLAVLLFSLRSIVKPEAWNDKWLKFSCIMLNVGLAGMVFLSLLPAGFFQIKEASEESGSRHPRGGARPTETAPPPRWNPSPRRAPRSPSQAAYDMGSLAGEIVRRQLSASGGVGNSARPEDLV